MKYLKSLRAEVSEFGDEGCWRDGHPGTSCLLAHLAGYSKIARPRPLYYSIQVVMYLVAWKRNFSSPPLWQKLAYSCYKCSGFPQLSIPQLQHKPIMCSSSITPMELQQKSNQYKYNDAHVPRIVSYFVSGPGVSYLQSAPMKH